MSSAHEAWPKARARKQVVFQDFDVLKARKQQLKNDLKEMNKAVKMQQQKKRRLMKAAHNLHDDDLVWLLRECENQRNSESNQNVGDGGVNREQQRANAEESAT